VWVATFTVAFSRTSGSGAARLERNQPQG